MSKTSEVYYHLSFVRELKITKYLLLVYHGSNLEIKYDI